VRVAGRRAPGIVLVVASALVALGCSIDNGVEVDETDAWIPTLRITIPEKQYFAPQGDRQPGQDEPPPRPPRQRAELNGSVAFADLSPPESGDVRLFELSGALRSSAFGTEKVDLDLIYGLAYNNLDVEINSGPVTGSQGADRFGPIVGTELTWYAVERLNVYGRATYAWGIPDTGSGQAEAGLQFQVTDELFALLAWRYWRYRRENLDNDFAGLDADIKLSGVVLGIQLSF
jgi:hypothetical protein